MAGSSTSPETGKFKTARCVLAPQRAFAGTSISPIVSRSTRFSPVLMPHHTKSPLSKEVFFSLFISCLLCPTITDYPFSSRFPKIIP